MPNIEIIKLLALLELKICQSGSLTNAKDFAKSLGYPDDQITAALLIFGEKRSRFENLEPAPIASDNRLKWYSGPDLHALSYWSNYIEKLKQSGWTKERLEKLDHETSLTMDLIDPPGNNGFATRGLVVGKVQSGKTSHFTGLIAKAADSGFKLVIILSGITNSLRLQTQKRLERDLSSTDNIAPWYWLTRREVFGDFERLPQGNVNICFQGAGKRSIAVVKKNPNILVQLINWFLAGNKILREQCPVLVIDDEADQASINTGRTMNASELTKINSLLVQLLKSFPKCAYVGYTATPFANVLTHPDYPENLYPRDFIYSLNPPPEYFGAARIHGRERISPNESDEVTDGIPIIQTVPIKEISQLKPTGKNLASFEFKETNSMVQAMRYFFMATAARLYRQKTGLSHMDFSTMLIHTSQRVKVHAQTSPIVSMVINRLKKEAIANDFQAWKTMWIGEMLKIDREKLGAKLDEVSFDQLRDFLVLSLEHVKVVISNSMRNEEANVVFEDKGQIMVVIGGNTLSRGLTLEGLVVSYFIRSANAYDTILQMGRWFGYRPTYEDLPRIWMTSEMKEHFFEIGSIEAEFQEQLDDCRAKNLSPLAAAIRIRRLPRISITAANKMRFAINAQVSYGCARPQTTYFAHRDKSWLYKNIEVAKVLLDNLGQYTLRDNRRIVWRNCNVSILLEFLSNYNFHQRSRDMDAKLLIDYVRKQNEVEGLKLWSVVLQSREMIDDKLGKITLRDDITVNLINRSKLQFNDDQTASIKTLMSTCDIVADFDDFKPTELSKLSTNELFKKRTTTLCPVLILYPISKNSYPQNPDSKKCQRINLDAVEHIIGLALVFPDAVGQFGGSDYVQAQLPPQESTISSEPEDESEE